MDWEPDGFSIKRPVVALPSLIDSHEIDENLATQSAADEPVRTAEKPNNPVDQILQTFPHIIARVVEFWGREKDFDDYMNSVVFKDRSSRAGFPKGTLEALMEIWDSHRERFSKDQSGMAFQWESDTRLHRPFKKLEEESTFIRRMGLTGAEAALLDAGLTDRAAEMATQRAEEWIRNEGKPLDPQSAARKFLLD